jgi:H+/Cl- antiporter ClcA
MTSGTIRDPSQVPAGIFLPTIAIGAAFGRAIGLLTYGLILLVKP